MNSIPEHSQNEIFSSDMTREYNIIIHITGLASGTLTGQLANNKNWRLFLSSVHSRPHVKHSTCTGVMVKV